MIKVLNVLLLICVIAITTHEANCQEKNLVVGEKITGYFFDNIDHYTKAEASIDDFYGKWLVMDFWTRNCPACIWGFPKIYELQKEFNKDVNFLLVGINDQYGWQIESFYAGVRVALRLKLPIAYDSMLWRKFGFQTVPHIVVINPNGIVRGIIPGDKFDGNRLREIMKEEED